MSRFLENFYGTLFAPAQTFDELKQNPKLVESFAIVVFVSILNPLINSNGNLVFQGFNVISAAIGGLISWVFFAAFLEMLAGIFQRGGKIKTFLNLSAFSLLPWIFTAPISLFKTGGFFFQALGVIFGLLIWLWATVLTAFAIMKVYEISSSRIVTLLLIPSFGGILGFYWFFGFFSTLFKIIQ
jgi:hypothetical protein